MRRLFVVLLLLAVIGGIGWWLWGWNTSRSGAPDPWRTVAPNAAVILEVHAPLSAWDRFKSTSQSWNGWSDYPGCKAVDSLMVSLRTLFADAPDQGAMAESSTLLAVLTASGDGFNTTLCWAFADERAVKRLVAAIPGLNSGRTTVKRIGALPAMECAISGGTFLLSTSSQELTDALGRLSGSVQADSLLTAARNTLGTGGDAHLLVHAGRAQRMLTAWSLPELMNPLEEVDGWVALDMRARPEATLFSGLLFTSAPPRLLRTAQEQGSGIANMGRVLPAGITSLWQVNITDPEAFHRSITPEDGDPAIFEAYGAWAYGALGIALAGSPSDSSERAWAVIPTLDPERATRALTARCPDGCDTLSYRTVRMSRSADTSALAAAWGGAFDRFERPWWCVLNDRVVFSTQVNALREAIDAWQDGSSFQQDMRSGSMFRKYAADACYTWWCDGASGIAAIRPRLKEPGMQAVDAHAAGWRSISGCLVQLLPDAPGRYQITACMTATGGTSTGTTPGGGGGGADLWSVSLGTPIIAGPWALTDHLSRTQQVLVQDRRNRIHLISCTGKVLWQREVDGPILGGVHQVDRYKNGKLQMLFNTAARIYLIDRNGEDVDRFPVQLPTPASGPANVFDYDGQKEYRVLVPTGDERLLNFDMTGKPVDGWSPPKMDTQCTVPPEHLRIRGKDYIVSVDGSGHVSVLDRRGETRYTPKLVAKDATRFIGLVPGPEIGESRLLWEDVLHDRLSGTFSGTIDSLGTAQDSLHVEGLIRYPATGLGDPPRFIADIDLDGTRDRVTVDPEGRVTATPIAP